jgi:hypothetical protein
MSPCSQSLRAETRSSPAQTDFAAKSVGVAVASAGSVSSDHRLYKLTHLARWDVWRSRWSADVLWVGWGASGLVFLWGRDFASLVPLRLASLVDERRKGFCLVSDSVVRVPVPVPVRDLGVVVSGTCTLGS